MNKPDEYGTHREVLEEVLASQKPGRVIELGMGECSTPLLVSCCEKVVSVEESDLEWYCKMVQALAKNLLQPRSLAAWVPLYLTDFTFACAVFKELQQAMPFDMVFVDGARYARTPWINLAAKHGIPTIVVHDTNKMRYYFYDDIKLPASYSRTKFSHKPTSRCTSVFQLESNIPSEWKPKNHTVLSFVPCR